MKAIMKILDENFRIQKILKGKIEGKKFIENKKLFFIKGKEIDNIDTKNIIIENNKAIIYMMQKENSLSQILIKDIDEKNIFDKYASTIRQSDLVIDDMLDLKSNINLMTILSIIIYLSVLAIFSIAVYYLSNSLLTSIHNFTQPLQSQIAENKFLETQIIKMLNQSNNLYNQTLSLLRSVNSRV